MALAVSAVSMASAPKPANATDSLSYYLGATQGAYLESQLSSMPAGDLARFNKDSFIKGVSAAILGDTLDVGYIYGLKMGADMAGRLAGLLDAGVSLDRRLLAQAFAETFSGNVSEAQADSLNRILMPLYLDAQKVVSARMDALNAENSRKADSLALANEEAGAKYLAALMAKDKKIRTTPSGLAYKVLKKGKGNAPQKSDEVELIFSGRLIDGTEFDSSNGEPVRFVAANLIKGFSEGLQLMPVGSKYTLYIPASIGYGRQGAGAMIQPGAMLVFDVEVLGFQPAKVIEE